jgi:hypothetical protein
MSTELMYPTIIFLSYGTIIFGSFIFLSNAFQLVSHLKSPRPDTFIFLCLGALSIGLGLFMKSRSMDDWQHYLDVAGHFFVTYKIWIISAVCVSVGGVVLVGLPGAAILGGLDPLIEVVAAKPLGWSQPHGDTTWPLALFYSVAAPWLFFGIYYTLKKTTLLESKAWQFGGVFLLTFLALLLIHLLYRFSNR